ncbi:MAG TPA: isoprenyl transferase [Opitutae bacterium]|nr:isoprenyl transferase [Coraliomargarita sp.]HBO57263.1 isoprenyl transferase [Opitutae bacterium]|tara:strand:- start:23 stop:772 length:750 start_codon:yes stop_codon:yes gene_type:complete
MKSLTNQADKTQAPKHVAIIMDGNGRWAKAHNLPRIEGHRQGTEAVKRTLKLAQDHGIPFITLYAFSVENWNRPKDEVDALMDLLDKFLADQLKELIKREIRLRVIGRFEELPAHIQERLQKTEQATAHFTKYTLGLALNYGSRTEIIDALRAVTKASKSGDLNIDNFDYNDLRRYLQTGDMPDPDLIIRTSGESRLSNFLLLQSAYAEIHITSVLWPDFGEAEFKIAIKDYVERERRYGKTSCQLHNT